jgi:hypothetical protein
MTGRALVGAIGTDRERDIIAMLEQARKAGYEAGYAAARIEVAERSWPRYSCRPACSSGWLSTCCHPRPASLS